MILAIPVLFAGTTGKISGRVTDKETGEPLIGANVMVDGTPLGAATDTDGNYFDLWMDSFQPERFYKIVYKVVDTNTTKYFDDDFSFKVVR